MEDRSGKLANREAHGYDTVRGGLWILSGVFWKYSHNMHASDLRALLFFFDP